MCIYRDLLTRLPISLTQAPIHLSIDPFIVLLTYLLIRPLALFLLFWLGSACDHGPHKPTTTLFHYTIDRTIYVLITWGWDDWGGKELSILVSEVSAAIGGAQEGKMEA